MDFVVSVRRWAAWAPGLSSADRWDAWAAQPWLPSGDEVPAVEQLPAMQRRRLTPLGRAAVQVAWTCQGGNIGLPLIFASRYGDVDRSLELLRVLDASNELSPTGFGMSVHNAVSGMYSIARSDVAAAVCVASGVSSAGAGLIEAAGLLADGAPEVMLVAYDEPLPAPYESFADEPPCHWAWAWQLASPQPGDATMLRLRLGQASVGSVGSDRDALPFGLALLRASLHDAAPLSRCADGRHWQVQRVREAGHA